MRSSLVCAFAALALCQCKVDIGDDTQGGTASPGTISAPSSTGGSNATASSGGRPAVAGNGSAGAAGMPMMTGSADRTGSAGMGSGGRTGSGGMGSAGRTGSGGMGSAGMGGADAGSGGRTGSGGMGSGGASGGDGETGRNVGMTAAHNVVRANASNPTPNPALPPLTWSADLAETAQAYAEKLAASCSNTLVHSMTKGLGENLAASFGGPMTAQEAVDGWASEKMCWTYGNFGQTDACDETCAMQVFSSGCGHYTQLVWRDSTQVGCGVASCGSGFNMNEYWVCNYSPQGNIVYEPSSRPPY